jgi:TolA-binding protein
VLGSYFVDMFYNHLYNSTKLRKGERSITDAYRGQVQAYILAIQNDNQLYRATVVTLHTYFRNTTSFATISFNSFVDKVVEQFVPKEYLDLYETEERDEVLSSILCDLVASLGAYCITSDMLARIIDHHSQHQVSVRMMQDHAITIMLSKRDKIHAQLISRATNAKDVVSVSVVNSLTEKIHELAKEKVHMLAKIEKLKDRLEEAEETIEDYEETIEKLERKESGKGRKEKAHKKSSKESGKKSKKSGKESGKKSKKSSKESGKKAHKGKTPSLKELFGSKDGRVERAAEFEELAGGPSDNAIIDKERFRAKREEIARSRREQFASESEDGDEDVFLVASISSHAPSCSGERGAEDVPRVRGRAHGTHVDSGRRHRQPALCSTSNDSPRADGGHLRAGLHERGLHRLTKLSEDVYLSADRVVHAADVPP